MTSPHERIRKLRRAKDLTGAEVAEKLGISAQYYYNIEKGRRGLSAENAVKLADLFDVTLDYLLGQSVTALIEDHLKKKGMTMKELSEKTNEPITLLQNLDFAPPAPWDYEPNGIIDKISKALGIEGRELFAAFSRQEPPAYEGPRSSPEEDFADEVFEEPETIAAHHDGEDWTEEELEEIERFKEFVRSRREKKK
ncbi:hypothetical protein DLM86_00995 [Paenibacillus flagellatus]|uniref:HTH cro/C1-type domain-containing protein n=1 Tax=Paenibacillus flagellatus TaxID=2211139 RepID=A0A2V5L2U2_9BACL|nr:hypothetical protein DLM86_00995 [Paenibacillus flagellatus]